LPPREIPPDPAARRIFLRSFLHDLATPLSAVSLHLEGADRRLRRGADPSESIATARAELAKAFELFDRGRDLLLSAPGEASSFAFDTWVEGVVWAADRDVPITGSTGGQVRGDRSALTEALRALVANALANGSNGVSVRRDRASGSLRVAISNSGRLPADDPDKLFAPRAAAPGKNWGMGLPMARLYAADAGGSVGLAQGEEGVTATLQLPEESRP
jgi:signal transduction histidine kinase